MVGKKMQGTGLGDIFLEAGLITSGSLHSILAGKQYARAMTCHKTMLEALERLLLLEFLVTTNRSSLLDKLDDAQKDVFRGLLETPSVTALGDACANEALSSLILEYSEFKQTIRDGDLGKTAILWISYMDDIWMMLNMIHAVKVSNIPLYCECLYRMADIFFSFDGQNYARYLSFFSVFLANVDDSHPGAIRLLQDGGVSVARSMIPGNRCPVDKTMEETFMKSAKSHGGMGSSGAGLQGLVNDPKTYQRWVRTTHERTRYVEATLSMVDMMPESRGSTKHKDLRPSEVMKSEKSVSKTTTAIRSFMNPFDVDDREKLYSLSSGAPATVSVEGEVLSAEKIGKAAKERFIRERLETKDHFFEPIKRMKLKTMSLADKSIRVKTSKNKIIELKQQSTVMLSLLMQIQNKVDIDVEVLMSYPLTPVPYSLGTADGYLTKTDKSKGFDYLMKGIESAQLPDQETTLIVEDGNALFYYMTEVPKNFKEISEKVYSIMGKTSDVICSTDMYLPNSIKSMETPEKRCW